MRLTYKRHPTRPGTILAFSGERLAGEISPSSVQSIPFGFAIRDGQRKTIGFRETLGEAKELLETHDEAAMKKAAGVSEEKKC